jgi:glycosyltransferase involved in cell wall biosynthesis
MNLHSFEDFLNENVKSVSSKKDFMNLPPKDVKFGILTVTYKRKDGKTPEMLKETIQSALNQSHDNWKIYLIGDDYEDDEELQDIIKMVPSDKIVFHNEELPGERLRFKGQDLWYSGSNAAANVGLDMMKKDGIEWVTRLDHDDIWLKDHLKNFARAIGAHPELMFMSSAILLRKFIHGNSNYIRPKVLEKKSRPFTTNNITTLKDCWHSAICWNLKEFNNYKYRNVREQMLTEPVRDEPAGGDRDMIERLMMKCWEKDHKWMLIPEVSVLYRNKEGKLPRTSKK